MRRLKFRCEDKRVIEMKDMVCKNCMSDGEWEYVEEFDGDEYYDAVDCFRYCTNPYIN